MALIKDGRPTPPTPMSILGHNTAWGLVLFILFFLALVLALSGCAFVPNILKPSDNIKFNRGAFIAAYIKISRVQAVAEAELTRFCTQEKDLSASREMCRDLSELNRQYYLLDKVIMRAIVDPDVEVDWQAVTDLLDLALKIGVKIGAGL